MVDVEMVVLGQEKENLFFFILYHYLINTKKYIQSETKMLIYIIRMPR